MKKISRILGLICIIFVLSIVCPTVGYASESNKIKFKVMTKSEDFKRWESFSAEERENTIQPLYNEIDLKGSIKRSKYNSLLGAQESSELGSSFDLRDNITSIVVKDQKQTGDCWAFSYSSAVETTIAQKYDKKSEEYSPMHIDYKTSQIFNRKIGEEGNAWLAMAYSADGAGPVYEEDFRYTDVYDEQKFSEDSHYLANIEDVNLDQPVRARVKDTTAFASIYKSYSEDGIKYTKSLVTEGSEAPADAIYEESEVMAIRQLIKNHIKQYGAVVATMYSDIGILGDELVSKRWFL